MWPAWIVLRTYGPYLTFPIALVAGFIGYNLEERFRTRRREFECLEKSVVQQRLERQLRESEDRRRAMSDEKSDLIASTSTLSSGDSDLENLKTYVPKSSLERNRVGSSAERRFW